MKSHFDTNNFLAGVPEEIQLLILTYLSPRELAIIMLVCSQTNRLANDPTLWINILRQRLKSTYSPNPGEELKEIVHTVKEFSQEEGLLLALTAMQKANLNAAKLILQTPRLMDQITDKMDVENLGVAHEEAARIILQTPELMEKIIGKPITMPNLSSNEGELIKIVLLKEASLNSLINIIAAHQLLAQEFLSLKESTKNALKSWMGSADEFKYTIHGATESGQLSDEASLNKFTDYFLELLSRKVGMGVDSIVTDESAVKLIPVTDRHRFWTASSSSDGETDESPTINPKQPGKQ